MKQYHSTPFPSMLIDCVMPQLKDTEWRLLCILVRQTIGWGKEWEWLSTSQLKSRTGRESAAISHSIAALMRYGLLEVRTRSGRHVNSARERRKAKEGLLFRLQIPATFEQTAEKRKPKSEDNNR